MKLCDTSVLVDIDRGGIGPKISRLDEEGRHAISMVSVTDLRLGVELAYDAGTPEYRKALDALDRLLARFDTIPIDRPTAVAASDIIATLRDRGKQLDDLHDIYVAAAARTEECPVLTAKVDDFERIPRISVIDWQEF
jgi:tRNA(fMet)-specific endonuclease VapC